MLDDLHRSRVVLDAEESFVGVAHLSRLLYADGSLMPSAISKRMRVSGSSF